MSCLSHTLCGIETVCMSSAASRPRGIVTCNYSAFLRSVGLWVEAEVFLLLA